MKKNYTKPMALVCNMDTDEMYLLTVSSNGVEERRNVIFEGNSRRSYDDEDEEMSDIW